MLDTINRLRRFFWEIQSHKEFNNLEVQDICIINMTIDMVKEYEIEFKFFEPLKFPKLYYDSKLQFLEDIGNFILEKLETLENSRTEPMQKAGVLDSTPVS